MAITSAPGTRRNSSGSVVAPDRRMSSAVMTVVALGASSVDWARRHAVTTRSS